MKKFYALFRKGEPLQKRYVLVVAPTIEMATAMMNSQFNLMWDKLEEYDEWPAVLRELGPQGYCMVTCLRVKQFPYLVSTGTIIRNNIRSMK